VNGEEAHQRALGRATAQCRGCARWIVKLDEGWIDAAGVFACVKAPLPQPGEPWQSCVLHQPMPDGLRGAPS
jgi:hypothetical protein